LKRFLSIPIAISLFAALLVSAGAYFQDLEANSHNAATVDARPVAASEPVEVVEPGCEVPVFDSEVVLPEAAMPVETIPGVNAPTPAPMVFKPPQPNGQVVCVEVQVQQMASNDGS